MRKTIYALLFLVAYTGGVRAQEPPPPFISGGLNSANAWTGNETHTGSETFATLILTGSFGWGSACTYLPPNVAPTSGQVLTSAAPSGANCQTSWTSVGGGSGLCALSGLSVTWILSVNPSTTCYGSADFTWNDATGQKNFIVGDGTNTQAADSTAAKTLQFTLGTGNSSFGTGILNLGSLQIIGETTSPISQMASIGRSNTLCNQGTEGSAGCANLYAMGLSNEVTGTLNWVVGQNNTMTSTGPSGATPQPNNINILGSTNTVAYSGTGSTSPSLTASTLVGSTNSITSENNNSQVQNVYLVGFTNTSVSNGSGTSGSTTTPVGNGYAFGTGNGVNASEGATLSNGFTIGTSNTDTANGVFGPCTLNEAYAIGDTNAIRCQTTGTYQEVYLLGANNTSGNIGTAVTRAMALGFSEIVNSCSDCIEIGENSNLGLSHSVSIGLSTVPEIVVQAGSIKFNAPVATTGISTTTDCEANSVSPAACGSASAGAFVVPTTTTTYTVDTTALKSTSSHVLLMPRTYTGALPSSPTCVAPAITSSWVVSAVSAGVSFTITLPSTTGQTCWDYLIVSN